jgi:hypothetical protein
VEGEEPRALHGAQGDPQPGGREEHRGERYEPQVEAVEAECVADPELLDPRVVGQVLQAGGAPIEVGDKHHGVAERHQRADQRGDAAGAPRQRSGDQRQDGRPQQQDGQVDGHAASRK